MHKSKRDVNAKDRILLGEESDPVCRYVEMRIGGIANKITVKTIINTHMRHAVQAKFIIFDNPS